jgi:hypothetical protein
MNKDRIKLDVFGILNEGCINDFDWFDKKCSYEKLSLV